MPKSADPIKVAVLVAAVTLAVLQSVGAHRVIEIDATFSLDGGSCEGWFSVALSDARFLTADLPGSVTTLGSTPAADTLHAFGRRLERGVVICDATGVCVPGVLTGAGSIVREPASGRAPRCAYTIRFPVLAGTRGELDSHAVRFKLGGMPRGVSLYIRGVVRLPDGRPTGPVTWTEGVRFPLLSSEQPPPAEDHDGRAWWPAEPSQEGVFLRSGFAAAKDGTVVHTIECPLAVAEGLLWIDEVHPGHLEGEDRQRIAAAVANFLSGRNRLLVNGRVLLPRLRSLALVGGDADGAAGSSYYHSYVRAEFVYSPERGCRPDAVTVRWQVFPAQLPSVRVRFSGGERVLEEHRFRPEEPEFVWRLGAG